MNTGIQDGISLANALFRAMQGRDDSVLDEWQKERLRAAHSVLGLADRMTKVATISSPALQALRNTVVELLGQIPFATHLAAEKLAELNN
jgi:2-polyprenyl-6-methoxyphenol hydroxylase-like FAD-dependent oxidoreductase